MKSLKILDTRLVHLKCTRPDWNIPARPRSRFTRCLHYLAAFVEHVHRSAWSLPFPVTLENVSLSGGGGARFLGSMACETAPASPAGNVASTKFPLPRPLTVPSVVLDVVLPRGVSLALTFSYRSCIVASLSDLPTHHSPLDYRILLVHLFVLLPSVPLTSSRFSTSNFVSPDIPELLVLAPFP